MRGHNFHNFLVVFLEKEALQIGDLLLNMICYDMFLEEHILAFLPITLLHSERQKLYTVLACLSAIGLSADSIQKRGKNDKKIKNYFP